MVNKLKNVNFMSGYQFDTVEEVDPNELNAVNIENDATFKSFVSGLGLPSDSYRNLTLGTSGASYTAPANGFIYLRKSAKSVGQYIHMLNTKTGIASSPQAVQNSSTLSALIEVKKGDNFTVTYTVSGDTSAFKFIYAEGETN